MIDAHNVLHVSNAVFTVPTNWQSAGLHTGISMHVKFKVTIVMCTIGSFHLLLQVHAE